MGGVLPPGRGARVLGHLVSLISCCRIQCGRGYGQDPRSDVHRMNTGTKSFDAELLNALASTEVSQVLKKFTGC